MKAKTKRLLSTLVAVALMSGLFAAIPLTAGASGYVEPMVDAGVLHSLALDSAGIVWAWGGNLFGQLGDGTTADHITPAQVTGLNGVTAIAAGANSSFALKSDGTVWAWGHNGFGQLGDGTTTNRNTPVQVTDLNGVTSVSVSLSHCMALKSDGTVWAWGLNDYGQLGESTTTTRSSPMQVASLSEVTYISASSGCSMAVKSDGTIWAWGRSDDFQPGVGVTTTWSCVPVQVAELSEVTAVIAGISFSMALKRDGTVWEWGGRHGDGSIINRGIPMQRTDLNEVAAITRGGEHTLMLKSDGTLWAWGRNLNGQLGDGTTTDRSTPVQATGQGGFISIAAGVYYSMVLKSDGTVWTCGTNGSGQLGDGTTTDRSTLAQVLGPDGVGHLTLSDGAPPSSTPPSTGTPSTGMTNFIVANPFVRGQFSDINENAWYGYDQQKVIALAYEYGLMQGFDSTSFNPLGNVTIAQALAIACRVHSIYDTGAGAFAQGVPWYQVYVDYAVANNIISDSDFTDYQQNATRAEMAYIFSHSLPVEEFAEINTVFFLPDVNNDTPYYSSILMLYKAGIVMGDDNGAFFPSNPITRAEASAIISRLILPDTRTSGMTYPGVDDNYWYSGVAQKCRGRHPLRHAL